MIIAHSGDIHLSPSILEYDSGIVHGSSVAVALGAELST